MAGLGCRVGRLLPRLSRFRTQAGSSFARMYELQCESNIRTMVLTSKCNLQSQVLQEETNEEPNPKPERRSRQEDELDRMLYKLDLEMRRAGRVNLLELKQVLSSVEEWKTCTSTQGQLLLRCCGSAIADERKSDRTTRMEKLVPLLKSYLQFEVSHYNAVLKVHLENENPIDISSFLAEMEADNVAPNRVTYQHIIGLYCLEGNLAGATTVLEHMKEADMTINESVFHSLLMGHCINKDKESVNETLEALESSGLLLGADTYTVILTSWAKARDWEKVEEVLVETSSKDINLDAGDYFKVIIALCENNMAEQAKPLVSKIPKRAGFLQEMRSAIPQVLFTGQIDLAFDIFNLFKVSDRDNRAHGTFMGRCLAKADIPPHKIAEHISQMLENGFTEVVGIYINESILLGKHENIKALQETLLEKNLPMPRLDSRYLVRNQEEDVDPKIINNSLKCLKDMDVRIEYNGMCRGLIHKSLNLDTANPSSVVNKIKSDFPVIPMMNIHGSMIAALLDNKSARSLQACAGFLLNVRVDTIFPSFWTIYLARSFLKNNSVEDLITILAVCRIKLKDNIRALEHLYEVLVMLDTYQLAECPNTSSLDVYRSVIQEINNIKIGIPRSTADKINDLLHSEEIKVLLDVSVSDFESDHWTEEQDNRLLNQLKKQHRSTARNLGYVPHISETRMYRGYFDIPDSLDEMLKIKNILKKRGEFRPMLADKIIQAMAEGSSPARTVEEIRETLETDKTFNLTPVTLGNVARSFIRNNDADGALKFFNEFGTEWFFSSFQDIVKAYAKKGEHEKVLELVSMKHEKKLIHADPVKCIPVLQVYQDRGDVDNLQTVFQAVMDNAGRMPRAQARLLMEPLVRVHLVNGDTDGALQAFTSIVQQHKAMPAKFDLMTKLVQEENVDGLQQVIDLSISEIGEEMSLYDLTDVFLREGRRAQAKKMLDTPGLVYNHARVTKMMDNFATVGRLDCVEDLVRLTKNIFGCERDYMYSAWVKAVFNSPEKVQEIWMEIQAEGHAPSTWLKTEIAKSLRSAGMDIPFETSDLDMDGKKHIEQPKPVEKKLKSEEKKQKVKAVEKDVKAVEKDVKAAEKDVKAAEKGVKAVAEDVKVSAVRSAISRSDIEGLVVVLKGDGLSGRQLKTGLNHLVAQGKSEEAKDVLKHIKYEAYQNDFRSFSTGLITKMYEGKNLTEFKQFIQEIPEDKRKWLKTDKVERNLMMADPENFYDLIKSASIEDYKYYKLPVKEIKAAFTKDNSLQERLDKLSVEGSIPATVLLARYSCSVQDKDALVKYWGLDNRDKNQVVQSFLVDIDNLDKLRWICDTLNYDSNVVRQASNKCLSQNKDKVKDILDYSLTQGLSLSDVNTAALRIAAEIPDYPHKEEVKRIIEERTNQTKAT